MDLHIHTSKSDGSKSFNKIIREAKQLNLEVIAITDHDVLNSITDDGNLKIITGIELSTIYNNGLFHVLGYHVDSGNKIINKVAYKNLLAEANNNHIKDKIFMTEYSNLYTYDHDEYERFSQEAKPIPGQQFISKAQQYLITKGYCKDRKEFFKKLLPQLFPNGIRFNYPKFISPSEAIGAIKQAGGVAILAHPFKKRSQRLDLKNTLKLFTDLGVDGFECFHPEADNYIIQDCLRWCKDNNKYISGGSDYHGGRFGRNLGSLGTHKNLITLPLN